MQMRYCFSAIVSIIDHHAESIIQKSLLSRYLLRHE
jgi:hypothetical protein